MNTVETRRMATRDIKELAKGKLIAEKRCSKHRDAHYSIICYGADSISLDSCRKWIYDEEMAIAGNQANAIVVANKTVLYVNPDELDQKIRELRAAGL